MFVVLAMLVIPLIAAVVDGGAFRADLTAERGEMSRRLLPALVICDGGCAYLWFNVGTGKVEIDARAVIGFALVCAAFTNVAINSLKSRRMRPAWRSASV